MRATPIPDNEIPEGTERMVLGPPRGSDPTGDIRAVEMVRDTRHGHLVFRARFTLEPGDLEDLEAGHPVWVSLWGAVVPFDADIGALQ